jgi:short-subunit dehydrogenase
MIVVITGASAGIGRALAEQLAGQGAWLVLSARRTDRLEQLNRSLGGGHLVVEADVSKPGECQRLIEQALQRFGRIDTLVCNAGYGIYKRVEQTSLDDTRAIFATNVFGTTDCIHFALPAMTRQDVRRGLRAQIMIVSSCVARRGIPFLGMYSATKAAQLSLAEALRIELKPSRIAVTTVHPIQTRTEFGEVASRTGEIKWPRAPLEQTVEVVARKMARAIERPRPEVWPSRISRWVFCGGTLAPRTVDRLVGRYRKKVERENSLLQEPT